VGDPRPEAASTKGCSRESSDPLPSPRFVRADSGSLNEGLLSREQRLTTTRSGVDGIREPQRRAALARAATPSAIIGALDRPTRPQRRAALARAATSCRSLGDSATVLPQRRAALARAATMPPPLPDPTDPTLASTKGCSRESSDPHQGRRGSSSVTPQRRAALARAATPSATAHVGLAVPAAAYASTKGCSRESSDLWAAVASDGHLARASTKGCSRESSDPERQQHLKRRQRPASTKGCSRESSDRRVARGHALWSSRLNEGLLSREQRPTDSLRGVAQFERPQRRAALARAATDPDTSSAVSTRRPQRRAALARAATSAVYARQATVSQPAPQRRAPLARAATSSFVVVRVRTNAGPQRRAALARAATSAYSVS